MERSSVSVLAIIILVTSCLILVALIAWASSGGTDDFVNKALAGDLPQILNVPQRPFLLQERYSALDYLRFAHIGVMLLGGLLVSVAAVSLVWLSVPPVNLQMFAYRFRLIERFGSSVLYVALFLSSVFIFRQLVHEGSFYTISNAIYFKVSPPFLHRVLFPSVARLLVEFASVNPYNAFKLTQAAVLLALFPIIQRWCRGFAAPGAVILAPILLLPFFFAMADYYTFYDLAIILFYTMGLTLLWEKRTLPYLFLVPIATLNHENFLLLILASGLLHNPFRPGSVFDWRFVVLQLVLYILTRVLLFTLLPVPNLSHMGNIWLNFHFLSETAAYPMLLWKTLLLFAWFGVSALGLVGAPSFLRKATVLLPLLIGVTFVFGQLNEARQFAAFVPVAVALIMSLTKGIKIRADANNRRPGKFWLSVAEK
jgi:hypothetical protein